MLVSIYGIDDKGKQTLWVAQCDLFECFPDDKSELAKVQAELEKTGRYWVGGGAAQILLLVRA